jgi:hypothetical protein
MWATKLKLAIVEKNTQVVDELLNAIPAFDAKEDAKEIEKAMFLLREALILVHTLQDETSASMQLIKQNIKFLKANQEDPVSSLNITS